jgi:hypothetical protein
MICSRSKLEWPRSGGLAIDHFCQQVLRARAVEGWASWKRSHAGIARRHARALSRQAGIRGAGAHNDPVLIIASFRRQSELASEGCARGELNRIATIRVIESGLEVSSGADQCGGPRRWSIRQRALHISDWQLCRSVVISAWWRSGCRNGK